MRRGPASAKPSTSAGAESAHHDASAPNLAHGLMRPRPPHLLPISQSDAAPSPKRGGRTAERAVARYSLSSFPTRLSVKNAPMYLKCGRTFMSTLYQPALPSTSVTMICALRSGRLLRTAGLTES